MTPPPAEIVSGIALAALVAALAVWTLRARRATPYQFVDFCFHVINLLVARILWRGQVNRPLPVAPGQGAIIVSNHRSSIDPMLIQLAVLRKVYWMVAREYMEHPLLAPVLRRLPSIPVSRSGIDTAATKQAIRLAQQGSLVGMFPEGRINVGDELLLPGRPGAAMVALKARVPVIPCFVRGAPYNGTAVGSFFMSANARVIVGQPIDTAPYAAREDKAAAMQELTKRLMVEIARLAGVESYEPKLAGRNWMPGMDNGNGKRNGQEQANTAQPVEEPSHQSAEKGA